MDTTRDDLDYLVFELQDHLYAFGCERLVQIIDSPKATRVPGNDHTVRGVIDFLGQTILLYDLRRILGATTLGDEIDTLVDSLAERKRDHINWLAKLKECVREGREISVQTNPHKCAFGRWYDSFVAKSLSLRSFMNRFDEPHQAIHAVAATAQKLIHEGHVDAAKALIQSAEGSEFVLLMDLFDHAEAMIRSTTFEYAVVMEHGGQKVALTVDRVKAFDHFTEVHYDLPSTLTRFAGGLIQGIGRLGDSGTTEDVLIVDADKLLLT